MLPIFHFFYDGPLLFQHMGSKDDFQVKIDENTKVKLDEMGNSVNQNKDAVIKRILTLVYDISPELHQNYRK